MPRAASRAEAAPVRGSTAEVPPPVPVVGPTGGGGVERGVGVLGAVVGAGAVVEVVEVEVVVVVVPGGSRVVGGVLVVVVGGRSTVVDVVGGAVVVGGTVTVVGGTVAGAGVVVVGGSVDVGAVVVLLGGGGVVVAGAVVDVVEVVVGGVTSKVSVAAPQSCPIGGKPGTSRVDTNVYQPPVDPSGTAIGDDVRTVGPAGSPATWSCTTPTGSPISPAVHASDNASTDVNGPYSAVVTVPVVVGARPVIVISSVAGAPGVGSTGWATVATVGVSTADSPTSPQGPVTVPNPGTSSDATQV